jgi:pyridoxamine 5'-phosphate oxidase
VDLSQFRREYLKGGLSRADLHPDPVIQFSQWFEQARKTEIADPTAMILATVGAGGRPSQRTVLLKYFDEDGLVFFTNYGSRKANEIAGNPQVSLLFVWLELERQVMLTGKAEKDLRRRIGPATFSVDRRRARWRPGSPARVVR